MLLPPPTASFAPSVALCHLQVIGVRPEVGLAKAAGLELGPRGGIKVGACGGWVIVLLAPEPVWPYAVQEFLAVGCVMQCRLHPMSTLCQLFDAAHPLCQVDEGMRTSDPHIWAVGDAVEVKVCDAGGVVGG